MGGAADAAGAPPGRFTGRPVDRAGARGCAAATPGPAGLVGAMLAALSGTALQLQQAALWSLTAYGGCVVAGALVVVGMVVGMVARAGVLAGTTGRLGWGGGGWPTGAMVGSVGTVAPLRPRRSQRRAAFVAWLLAWGALAFGATGWRAAERLADTLPAELEGQDLQLVGRVARLPQTTLAGTRFVFEVESARHQGRAVRVPPRVSLGWYRGPDAEAWLRGPEADLRAGQRWRLTARLRQPHGHLNPHGFDLELWLFEQGIGASGYVRSRAGAPAEKLDDAAGAPVERFRQRVRDAIDQAVPDAAAAGVLAALAIGDQGAIDRADWDLFRTTGVAHLMSISGLHVTMFAWLAAALIGRLWRRLGAAMLWCPAPVAARWGGLALAAGYAVLAGWGVPAQRTVLMLGTVAVLRSAGLRWPWPLVLLSAAVVVAAIDPWALLQPGFWLSFAAVGLLMLSDRGRPPHGEDASATWPRRAWLAAQGALHTQVVATVGLTPLTLVFFQQVSVVGFVANLVAIPTVTLLITPLALLGIVVPPLWSLGATVTAALLEFLRGLAAWPLAVWTAAAAPAWATLAGLLGGALLVMPLPWRHRLLGLPLVLPLLAPPLQHPEPGRFELVALDIGQGTAVLVRTARHLLVYDAGPQYSAESDAGQRVVLPLLLARGEPHIDTLVLSHRDSDHVGGAASLLRHARVRWVLSSLDEAHPVRALDGVPHERCAAGQRWHWDGVDFEMLHPAPDADLRAARPNTLSCVLRVAGTRGSALLSGDIEAAQEAALVSQHGAALRTDVLLVPHHGSRSSSTAAFIEAVAPRVAVVQAGYRSRFGHPAPDVVTRYRERGVVVVRSDACGAWTQSSDGLGHCQRRLAARYWHHGAGAQAAGPGAE